MVQRHSSPLKLVESCFPKVQSAKLNTDETLAEKILAKPQSNHAITNMSTPCGNYTITHFRGTDKTINKHA